VIEQKPRRGRPPGSRGPDHRPVPDQSQFQRVEGRAGGVFVSRTVYNGLRRLYAAGIRRHAGLHGVVSDLMMMGEMDAAEWIQSSPREFLLGTYRGFCYVVPTERSTGARPPGFR
jgi:hypothetical protein